MARLRKEDLLKRIQKLERRANDHERRDHTDQVTVGYRGNPRSLYGIPSPVRIPATTILAMVIDQLGLKFSFVKESFTLVPVKASAKKKKKARKKK